MLVNLRAMGEAISDAVGEVEEMGPVDYLVVEFPMGRSTFSGDIASELSRLSNEGVIRVLDLVIIQKDADGSVEGFEVEALDLDEAWSLEAVIAEILSATDVDDLAAAMQPGSVAGVVVWENLWAAQFASAARHTGAQLIAAGHIPVQAIAASIAADEERE